MKRLRNYTKPYTIIIIVAIGLLFVRAQADLALPDYLSDIVNVGIQQNGIEDPVPEAIRKQQMDNIAIFLNDNDETFVLDQYSLIENTSSNADDYLERYPQLADEAIYVLNDIDSETMDDVGNIIESGFIAVFMFEQLYQNPEDFDSYGMEMVPALNISMYPTVDAFFTALSMMPDSVINNITTGIETQINALGDTMGTQIVITAIRAEYEVLGMDMQAYQNAYILKVGGLMILLTLLSMAATIAVGYIAAKVATKIAQTLRKDVFTTIEGFSNTEFDQFSTASLITRSTNDITQIQSMMVMLIQMVLYAPILGIGGIINALSMGASMWYLIAIAVAVLIVLIMVVFRTALPKFKLNQKLVDRLNLVSRENLTGMMVIRAFNMESFEENRFEEVNNDLTKVTLFLNRLMVILMPMMMLIMNVLTVGIIWVGSHNVFDGNLLVGDMMAFMQYAMQIVMAFLMMSMMFIALPRAAVSSTRVFKVLNTEISIHDPKIPKVLGEKTAGLIEFENVSFRYPNAEEDAVSEINFTAKPGETTAIIGATGAGKSTIINLIPRFYDITQGSIKIDGMDIRELTQFDLREKIGFVPQKSNLFSGTIRSNLLYGDENANEEHLNKSIDIAQARVFLDSKPEGMNLEIAQGGMNVSGGQKQRISIARAIVKKPPIYILDDSFSALDFKTDAALRKAFRKESSESTLIIVSQRVSTIRNAEQILVLDEGKLVGKGTHKELMASCPTYKEIALSQHTMEELE